MIDLCGISLGKLWNFNCSKKDQKFVENNKVEVVSSQFSWDRDHSATVFTFSSPFVVQIRFKSSSYWSIRSQKLADGQNFAFNLSIKQFNARHIFHFVFFGIVCRARQTPIKRNSNEHVFICTFVLAQAHDSRHRRSVSMNSTWSVSMLILIYLPHLRSQSVAVTLFGWRQQTIESR